MKQEKLKTLKDFEFRLFTNEETNKFVNRTIKDKVKQEAIKWIKKDKADILKENSIITPTYLLKRFMRRFNLTEEDLKSGGKVK